jgi:cobalt/nickel transport system permease protein
MQHSFLDKYSDRQSFIHRLDPRIKIICLLLFVFVVVSTPRSKPLSFAVFTALILLLILISRIPIGYVLKRSCLVFPFTIMTAAFIPFWNNRSSVPTDYVSLFGLNFNVDGLRILGNVAAKSWLAALAMILLSSSTKFSSLLAGLEALRFPKLILNILSFMYRYIFILVDDAQRMDRARRVRYFGGGYRRQIRVLSNMIGLLFIRAYERGERVYQSMVSRGFDGNLITTTNFKYEIKDVVFAAIFLFSLITIRFWRFS